MVLVVVVSFSKDSFAADGDDFTPVNLDKKYLKGYYTDTKYILASPFRWDKKGWYTFGGVMAIGALIYVYDEELRDWTQDNISPDTNHLAEFGDYFGNGKYMVPGLFGFYAVGAVIDSPKIKRTALLGIESFIITGVLTQVGKLSFHRHRPRTGDPKDTFDGPSFELDNDNLAMPSGHTSTAFAIATVIATEYSDSKIIPVLSYSLAAIDAWSRMHYNAHWASDVFMGAALGYFVSKTIVKLHDDGPTTLTFMPQLIDDGAYISVGYRF